jgi:plastocyanin
VLIRSIEMEPTIAWRGRLPSCGRAGKCAVIVATAVMLQLAQLSIVRAASHEISIVDFEYRPSALTVVVGEPITWTNDATDMHTVTSDTGSELDSDDVAAGESYGHVFGSPGTYAYHCTIHPTMKGAIVVQGASASLPAPAEATPVPPEGTLPPNFSPGTSTGPLESPAIEPSPAPTPTPTTAPGSSATSDNNLPVIVGLSLAVILGAAVAYLLARGRPDRRS